MALCPGADPGGGGGSENLGIDLYSGFRGKNTRGGAIRNPKKSKYTLL